MHQKVCIVQGKTLEEAKYFPKTKYGVSDEFIQHSEAYPIFGIGRGSGSSPMHWLFISSTLFDIYDSMATGSQYESPNRSIHVNVKAIGFVDDVQTSVNAFSNNALCFHQLLTLATRDSQLWHDILKVSNQALELPKCGCQAIIYEFKPTGEPKLVDEPPSSIELRDATGQPLEFTKWKNTKAVKYLGAHKGPSDQKQQFQAPKKKCDDFSRVIKCSHLSHTKTQCFYWAIYQLSANYVLPTSYFTKKEPTKIQAKAHTTMVSRSGYSWSTPWEIIYGPKRYSGAGFFHLFDDQGFGQIKVVMKMWRSPTTLAGKLLRVAVS